MDPSISTFITILLGMVITAAVPVVTVFVCKFLVAKAAELRHAVTADQYTQFQAVVHMVVLAAEQSGLAKLILNTGDAKKQYAIQVLQDIVDARGLKIPIAQIEAEIEAAIRQGLQQAQVSPPDKTLTVNTGTTVNIDPKA